MLVGPAETIRLRPGVAFVPGLGHHAPPARHSSRFSFNSSTSHSPWFLDADRPARQDARAGRRGLAPREAPDWLRASGAAPGPSRAAMFATESIASFFPQAALLRPRASRPAADGVRMHLAPGAMGTRAPRDTPRLGRGRIAGKVEDRGHGMLSSFRIVRAKRAHTGSGKTKNRAADVPSELRHALHRRLPSRRNGELGARVTSGRDSR
jgi:hypothetical protein